MRYVRIPGSTMHCAPGEIGSVHNGLVIDQIHFNTRLMQNFMALETQAVRRSLLEITFGRSTSNSTSPEHGEVIRRADGTGGTG